MEWNGKIWVATGQGASHTLAYSYDGINWVGIGKTIFTNSTWSSLMIGWNGISWLATSGTFAVAGTGNFAASSYDGINWVNVTVASQSPTSFAGVVYDRSVIWDGIKWIIGGSSGTINTLWYTYDPLGRTGWLGGGIVLPQVTTLSFNGVMYIAGGANAAGTVSSTNMAYSYLGISTWTNIVGITDTHGRKMKWDGRKWIMTYSIILVGIKKDNYIIEVNGLGWV